MHSVDPILAFTNGSAPSALVQFVPIILIFAIFYFLLLAPMRRRQKALQKTIENLKRGDRVVTTGGFYGRVVAIEENDLILELADNVKVRVAKSAVAGLEDEE
ncbi:MAG: preprotein translocase subunit YajC [Thermoanaerobaculia bacterium]|nr:preprotein translocase subunit YajC [Thermoanaerobaculia bacterium]